MKKNIEITGEIDEVIESYVGIRLHICSFEGITDFFAVDTKEKEIITKLNEVTKILLKMEHTFEDYMQLIKDLGLEMPSKWKKHWTPAEEWDYYSIGQGGNVEGLTGRYGECSARFRKENYNAFPTRELAEKGVNASKLGRLILLWQYANDCLFMPDWKNNSQRKHFIKHDHINNTISCNFSITAQLDIVYFETEEQVEAFIEMYGLRQRVKKVWGVI